MTREMQYCTTSMKWFTELAGAFSGSYHKRQISNPPTPLPPIFKTAKFQIHQRQRRFQPNLTCTNIT